MGKQTTGLQHQESHYESGRKSYYSLVGIFCVNWGIPIILVKVFLKL